MQKKQCPPGETVMMTSYGDGQSRGEEPSPEKKNGDLESLRMSLRFFSQALMWRSRQGAAELPPLWRFRRNEDSPAKPDFLIYFFKHESLCFSLSLTESKHRLITCIFILTHWSVYMCEEANFNCCYAVSSGNWTSQNAVMNYRHVLLSRGGGRVISFWWSVAFSHSRSKRMRSPIKLDCPGKGGGGGPSLQVPEESQDFYLCLNARKSREENWKLDHSQSHKHPITFQDPGI